MSASFIDSPIGRLRVETSAGVVCKIDFHWRGESFAKGEEPLLLQVEEALHGYFQQPAPLQHIPHSAVGTPFQQRVWKALCEIPLGEVLTYGELARLLGSSPRAVGGACRSNPIPLIVPCHRVVAKSGIGGFAGHWGESERVDVKQWLLQHERGLR